MGGLLGGNQKAVQPPPVPEPPPVPITPPESGEEEAKKQRRKSGFSKTFLTGNLTPKSTGLSRTLG